MANEQIYKVYTRWLAVELRKLGFKILSTEINEYHPQFDIWIFENTEQLHKAILQLTTARKSSKE